MFLFVFHQSIHLPEADPYTDRYNKGMQENINVAI